MEYSRRISTTICIFQIIATFVMIFIYVDSCNAQLSRYNEIHEAKNLIDALSSKLHLDQQTYESKYENLKYQSNGYLEKSDTTQEDIKMLNKLKELVNDLSGKSTICERFYADIHFNAVRQIIFFGPPLPKDYTVAVEVNHLDLINKDMAMSNGNDLRVYFRRDSDCKPREIDRILENIATASTKVWFKLQEESLSGSSYYLAYGNKDASRAKQSPEGVYLFYDDFSDSDLEKKWQKNWGTIRVENGELSLRSRSDQSKAEIAIFAKNGYDWQDIEVDLEFLEKSNHAFPGVFLRVSDARIESTSAWNFEYYAGTKRCRMRPYKNNNDLRNWMYRRSLTRTLDQETWTRAKYRVVGDRFSHWINGNVIHDDLKVSRRWYLNKGTLGLGCRFTSTTCRTYYRNIKITKYSPVLPTVSLDTECKVDLEKFHGLGTSEKNPATSCKQIHDVSWNDGDHRLRNGVYWIKTSADQSVPTYCDLAEGGWTLVGKVSGFVDFLYTFWLIKNYNENALRHAGLPSEVGCIDARYLATYHASTIRFSSGENRNGMGSYWVQWALPEGRDRWSLWSHSVGIAAVLRKKMHPVIVEGWDGEQQVCYQNKFGIMPHGQHGGSYPAVSYNTEGKTKTGDYCMAIGVLKSGRAAHGWTQNTNGYDSPNANSDWLNARYNHQAPWVTVWLR